MDQKILPVLLGGDMNCYTVARAFHEAYGVVSHAFGRWPMGETRHSRIVRFTAVEQMDTDPVLLKTLADFAAAHPGETKILLGCTDDYVGLIIRNRAALQAHYIVPYIDEALADRLEAKESFYRLCDEYGIPYPATRVLKTVEDLPALDDLPFPYPVVVKPSSSIDYWKHPFEGMQKVYVAQNAARAREIAGQIFAAGYPESLIVQDVIPGADDGMRVLTTYSDQAARVKMACLGHVLLEEHTPKAVGNHAAIITECDRPLMEKLAALLEALGYTGFANFDIKHDPRDGQYKVFEINLRQGRSNYYVTGAGLNVARYLVEDRVLQKDLGPPVFFDKETFWRSIPAQVVWRYTADETLAEKARVYHRAGRETTALDYGFDLRLNPLRRAYLWEHYRRYHKKYATYCKQYR